MDFDSFHRRANELWQSIPVRFREGVSALVIERGTRDDPEVPDNENMWDTFGECAADPVAIGTAEQICSTIIIYYGAFAGAAERGPFDWDAELWETLTHELLHHLEWRAGYDALGDLDDIELANFLRKLGRAYPDGFHRGGTRLARNVYAVGRDLFVEMKLGRAEWSEPLRFDWEGVMYEGPPPGNVTDGSRAYVRATDEFSATPPEEPPPFDDVVFVVRRKLLG